LKASTIICEALKEKRKNLLETEAKTICAEYEIPVTDFGLAKTREEAAKLAERIFLEEIVSSIRDRFKKTFGSKKVKK